MTGSDFTVFIVDDDAGVLKALARLVRSAGFDVQAFASPEAFLAGHDPARPGCAILDVAMPGLDGLQLQQAIAAAGIDRAVIFLTGRGDIPTSVRAMKAGALDFLTKPVSEAGPAGGDRPRPGTGREATSIPPRKCWRSERGLRRLRHENAKC